MVSRIPWRQWLVRRLVLARGLSRTVLGALSDEFEEDLGSDFDARVTREERAKHLHLRVGEEVDVVVEI